MFSLSPANELKCKTHQKILQLWHNVNTEYSKSFVFTPSWQPFNDPLLSVAQKLLLLFFYHSVTYRIFMACFNILRVGNLYAPGPAWGQCLAVRPEMGDHLLVWRWHEAQSCDALADSSVRRNLVLELVPAPGLCCPGGSLNRRADNAPVYRK
jgi:hypothetical protein